MSQKNFRNIKQKVKTARGRKNSSTRWLQRHINDPYVTMAKQKGYRARAAFKLLDIDEKFKILKGCKCIVDLGCAPGGWLQVAKEKCSKNTTIIGIDLQEVDPVAGVNLIHGDFYDDEKLEELVSLMPGKADLIMSDMAASACGNKQVDHMRIIGLVEAAFDFAKDHLNEGGHFIAKMLRGGGDGELIKLLKLNFKEVKQFKPDSSYSDSSEMFVVCKGFKGLK